MNDFQAVPFGMPQNSATCPACGSTFETDSLVDVGDVLHGFCGGAFGRDAYECKQVEAVGADWVVCRRDTPWGPEGAQYFASGNDIRRELVQYRTPTDICGCEDKGR